MPSRCRIIAGMVVALILGVGPANADCPFGRMLQRPPEVVLVPLDGGISYDTTRSSDEIAAIDGQSHGHGMATRGLTATTFRSGVSVSFLRVPESGGVCLLPVRIEAKVGYDPMVVYIDRKYPQGSCPFNAVLAHEHQHVRINRETLAAFLPRINGALQTVLTGLRQAPIRATNAQAAEQAVISQVNAVLEAETLGLRQQRDALHAQLDSPQSYRATQDSCPRW